MFPLPRVPAGRGEDVKRCIRHHHWLVAVGLAPLVIPVIGAASRCPGNVAAVTSRFVQRAFIVIPVTINHAGPFDFLVDTGSQATVLDPPLAAQLNLKPQGIVRLIGVANLEQAFATILERVETSSNVVENSPAAVQDLRQIQAADPLIRGVLGESFLAHFDLFVDYPHRLVCLDETSVMRKSVHGERIPFVRPERPENELPYMERLVISATLSGAGARTILLQLDSGSDGPILYAGSRNADIQALERSAVQQRTDVTGARQNFAVMPRQTMQIGSRIFPHIWFRTPVGAEASLPGRKEDGLLPTLLFQRVLISGSERYVVFDPE
jgi:hypothetical protein